MKIPWRKYTCCGGSPTCANNKTRLFIDHLWLCAIFRPKRFMEELWDYIENVETDRDMFKMKYLELRPANPEGGR